MTLTVDAIRECLEGVIPSLAANEAEVNGLRAYQSVSQVPGAVGFAVIILPHKDVPTAMRDCVQKQVKAAVIISGGLAETGAEGARIHREVVEIARAGGIRFVGPNCMGHFDTTADFFTVPYLPPVRKGPLSAYRSKREHQPVDCLPGFGDWPGIQQIYQQRQRG